MTEHPYVAPVELTLRQDHKYKSKGPRRHGCAVCNKAQRDPAHLGAPPSMNDGGSGMDRMQFYELKRAWMRAIAIALAESGLERGLEAVNVEVLIGFDRYQERDEGNVRWMIEKALGDVLVHGFLDDRPRSRLEIRGGWLTDDTFWPTRRYSMGNLQGQHTPGESWTKLRIFPSMIPPVPEPRAGETQALELDA